ncbi:MAG: hypothetical protein CVV24_10465 [Ignavibacteriae bacterium HGW-Ignavibacteriae-3]|nr:MAG: hypothetical protein CVV24_10465 [Ignavibacteriae bacterium HGW-Ignavibacteriae-3]
MDLFNRIYANKKIGKALKKLKTQKEEDQKENLDKYKEMVGLIRPVNNLGLEIKKAQRSKV